MPSRQPCRPTRRALLGGTAAAAATSTAWAATPVRRRALEKPVLVGSGNGLAGMREAWPGLRDGGAPLDAALAVVHGVESDPNDMSVGLGGLPNEDGVVQLDAACMDGETHNAGAVASIENIEHPSAVARLVMERTDHCLLVGPGAYEFARMHGHPHVDLLTERARDVWRRWVETRSDRDDYLAPPARAEDDDEQGWAPLRRELETAGLSVDPAPGPPRIYGTIHCSALSTSGHVACTTTTSGLSFKIPGRVGDSPILGAGLYCDDEAGSAGATGRGEAAILAGGSGAIVELLRRGASPEDAGLEVLERITRQTRRMASWQPGLLDDAGNPAFGLQFYVVGLDGRYAGVTMRGGGNFAVAGPDDEPRHEPLVSLHG